MFHYNTAEKIVLPIAALFIALITTCIYFILRNKPLKLRLIPFKVIAVVLIVLEIAKQTVALATNTYSKGYIPLHICSTFMLFYPFIGFCRGRLQNYFSGLGFSIGVLVSIALYINPIALIGNSCSNVFESFMSFHTFIYHHLLVLFTALMPTLKILKPDTRNFKWMILFCICYLAVLLPMSHVLNVNYAYLLYPNIEIFKRFTEWAGYPWYAALLTTLMVSVVQLAYFILVVLPYNIIYPKIAKKTRT